MVLVGPNQAGKSSVLKGLNSLSFDYFYDINNELTQLEKINKNYVDKEIPPKDLPIITVTFQLEASDTEYLKQKIHEKNMSAETYDEDENKKSDEATKDSLAEEKSTLQENNDGDSLSANFDITALKEIKVTKFIDGSYNIKMKEKNINYPPVLQLINELKKIIGNIESELSEEFTIEPNTSFKNKFCEIKNKLLQQIPKNGYSMPDKETWISPLDDFCHNTISDSLRNKINLNKKKLEQILSVGPDKNMIPIASFLAEKMPRTVYFKDYERLEDSLTLDELETNTKSHQAFFNLLLVAEAKLESLKIKENDPVGLQQYLESASATATQKIRRVWKQESFDLKIRYDQKRIMVFTTDPEQLGTLLPPSYGSEGFQWFLGFYINFAAATKTEYRNAILLLDDPGVLLHPTGHKDLLERFKSYLKDDVRTIYSTHLPSLIPKDSIGSIRAVYKKDGKTYVEKRFWKLSNKDIWEPIRSSLGIDLTDSLFLGNQTVMVEGPSDTIYLQEFLKIIQANEPNKSHRFILSLRGICNVDYYVTLFDTQGLPYVVVIDNATNSNLNNSKIIKIQPKNKFRREQSNFDIEDLMENKLLAEAFVQIYTDFDTSTVVNKLNNNNNTAVNILVRLLEDIGKTKKDLNKIELSCRVTRLVQNNPTGYPKTLENFQELLNNIDNNFKDQTIRNISDCSSN